MSLAMDYRAKVIAAIKTELPALVKVEGHGGQFDLESLDRIISVAPSCYVAVLGAKPEGGIGTGQQYLKLEVVAFVVARDQGSIDAEEVAWTYAEAIASLALYNCFNDAVLPAENIEVENLYRTAIDKRRIALCAAAWSCCLPFGKNWMATSQELQTDTFGAIPDDLTNLDGPSPITVEEDATIGAPGG